MSDAREAVRPEPTGRGPGNPAGPSPSDGSGAGRTVFADRCTHDCFAVPASLRAERLNAEHRRKLMRFGGLDPILNAIAAALPPGHPIRDPEAWLRYLRSRRAGENVADWWLRMNPGEAAAKAAPPRKPARRKPGRGKGREDRRTGTGC